ncbi:hypothetical protein ZIOFF_048220 [Zingiber officinale]|uniref:Tify domain-containing protein n=1 Tax=Zingiber officinale TaxID=94328 RepID=A0A8J5FPC5_ZINOF|nr:hypothetical protein ZIOFF_048220 [Zingiber officinale]
MRFRSELERRTKRRTISRSLDEGRLKARRREQLLDPGTLQEQLTMSGERDWRLKIQGNKETGSGSRGLKNSSASKRSPLPRMSGNLDLLDVEALELIAAVDAWTLQQYEEADYSSSSHRIEEEGVGAVENGEMEADGLSGPSHLGDTQPLITVQPCENQLTLSFQGEVYVFDSVSPKKVQAMLLLLGGQKRKERNFEKKIRYTVRKEVASSYLVTGEKSGEFTARLLEFIIIRSSYNHVIRQTSRNEQCVDAVWGSQNADALVLKESEIQGTLVDQNESTPEVDSFRSVDSFEGGRSSFNGASHPLEPMDTDLVKLVYVAIDQEKSDAGCLMKGISTKGPFIIAIFGYIFVYDFSSCLSMKFQSSHCAYTTTIALKVIHGMAASPLTIEYHSCSIRHEDLCILLLEITGIVVVSL